MTTQPIAKNEHLALLYGLSSIFNSSIRLEEVLSNVMDQVIKETGAQRGFVMLQDPEEQDRFVFQAARDNSSANLTDPVSQVSTTIAREVFQSQKPSLQFDAVHNKSLEGAYTVQLLQLHSVLCVPLIVKGKSIGVIYVDNSLKKGTFNNNHLEMLTAIATPAAVAIENARLFAELEKTYDTTLAGWASAMDLRDSITENHCQRVTNMTVELAQYDPKIDREMIVHIRRGATLHDVGKMGIPDAILKKPGPLDPAEWAVMKTHPQIAYDLLNKIPYLKPALSIPYCHHERWAGGGYPRGISGEAIPREARIFSLVDVYDALTSDRPYKKAMPKQAALAEIRKDIGRNFDPQIAESFIEYINSLPES